MIEDHADDLRNDVAGTLHPHGIANSNVLAADFVFIVQGGPTHRDAGDAHGVKHRGRGQRAGAAHVEGDVLNDGDALLRRELEGDGPARMVRGAAECLLQRQIVDFHDNSVRLVIQVVAPRFEFSAEGNNLIDGCAGCRAGIDAAAGLRQRLQGFPVGINRINGGRVDQGIDEYVQRAADSNARIQQP